MRAQHDVPVRDLSLRLCDNFTVDQVQLFQEVVVIAINLPLIMLRLWLFRFLLDWSFDVF